MLCHCYDVNFCYRCLYISTSATEMPWAPCCWEARALDPQWSQAAVTQGQDGLCLRNVWFFSPRTDVSLSKETTKEQNWGRQDAFWIRILCLVDRDISKEHKVFGGPPETKLGFRTLSSINLMDLATAPAICSYTLMILEHVFLNKEEWRNFVPEALGNCRKEWREWCCACIPCSPTESLKGFKPFGERTWGQRLRNHFCKWLWDFRFKKYYFGLWWQSIAQNWREGRSVNPICHRPLCTLSPVRKGSTQRSHILIKDTSAQSRVKITWWGAQTSRTGVEFFLSIWEKQLKISSPKWWSLGRGRWLIKLI